MIYYKDLVYQLVMYLFMANRDKTFKTTYKCIMYMYSVYTVLRAIHVHVRLKKYIHVHVLKIDRQLQVKGKIVYTSFLCTVN